ncbi:MAG: hypothetical protein O3B84_03730 [Chloroflexi bacterium]|nr:hypothetical protein [Chloroflexota bacterium]
MTVTENGRRLDRTVLRGSHEQTLRQAWREAVALHEKYGRRRAHRLTPEQRRRHALLAAIRRLERSRSNVLRALDSLDSQGHRVARAVEGFRASWEVLALEYYFLTGRSLTSGLYGKRLGEGSRRVVPLASEPP